MYNYHSHYHFEFTNFYCISFPVYYYHSIIIPSSLISTPYHSQFTTIIPLSFRVAFHHSQLHSRNDTWPVDRPQIMNWLCFVLGRGSPTPTLMGSKAAAEVGSQRWLRGRTRWCVETVTSCVARRTCCIDEATESYRLTRLHVQCRACRLTNRYVCTRRASRQPP